MSGVSVAVVLAVLFVSAEARHERCERISIGACSDLGYNLTTMPNFMDHKDQIQAERAVSQNFLL